VCDRRWYIDSPALVDLWQQNTRNASSSVVLMVTKLTPSIFATVKRVFIVK